MTRPPLKQGFSRFLGADPGRLHVAAHSHHPWPDASFVAQQDAWRDAASMMDRKWEHVFGVVVPEAQSWIARRLRLPVPADIVIAPNTHELVMRILSCLDPPVRVLTTGGEFTSFERQVRRLAEDGLVEVRRIPVHPIASLTTRLAEAAATGGYDLLFFSHVLFDSGAVVDVTTVVGAVPGPQPFVVIDGYHGFMAVPTDLSAVAERAFYVAGGYKYAMSGEGICFAHCPPDYGPRPRDTGWYADFSALEVGPDARVRYGPRGQRFMGATFDPTAVYRFNAVQRWLDAESVDVGAIHDHVRRLQLRFLTALADGPPTTLDARAPVAAPTAGSGHGHLLAFEVPDAAGVAAALARRDVVVDHRGSRVRLGLGVYHDDADLGDLLDRLRDRSSAP